MRVCSVLLYFVLVGNTNIVSVRSDESDQQINSILFTHDKVIKQQKSFKQLKCLWSRQRKTK